MKIGIVCDYYLPRIGGLELHLRDLSQNLVRRGHEVHLVCATQHDGPRDTEVEGVRIHRLDIRRAPRFDIMLPSGIAPLEAYLRSHRFDVLHTHNWFSTMAHAGGYLGRKLGVPTLFTECSVLAGWPIRIAKALRPVMPWGDWQTVLSGVSHFVAENVRVASGRDEVHVVHNGVDIARWACERREPSRPRVTTVMRFTYRKRPTDIIRIIPEVHARLPADLRPVFTLVGDGTQMQKVKDEAARLGVSEHIELPGYQSRERIRDILSESTVFVLPTRAEAMSIATVEALASGCPAVCFNLGGVSDVVQHGTEGFLASDMPEFVDYIVEVVQNHALRRKMAEATTKRVHRFTWDSVITKHEELFRLAQERAGGRTGAPAPAARSTRTTA
jgi:glycosyltransferase involved in cell wall biosynthesis